MREGTLNIHNKIGPETGAKAISLRVLEFGPGLSPSLRNEDQDEVLFSLSSCRLVLDELTHELEPQSGVFIPSQQAFRVENRGKDSVFS